MGSFTSSSRTAFYSKLAERAGESGAVDAARWNPGLQDEPNAEVDHRNRVLAAFTVSLRVRTRSVFEHFGKGADLPTGELVAVELMPKEAGEYAFACPMGMFRRRLIVE